MELGGKWPKVFVGALSFENRVSGFAGGMGLRAGVVEARQVVGCEGMGGGGSGGPGAAIGEGEEEGDSVLGGVMLWDGEFDILFLFSFSTSVSLVVRFLLASIMSLPL